ncbi:hypothetical protein [Microbacterium trichothecenolyticum]|uniref:Uncharacterized protein n=1 Tax=Microbacterium trichothecenolyticum TaxID=69370 RepID=A0A0M2H130_MICTR|nr:hypothetical protein [Microbacterium trichothecenolyticum]KJL39907.1 hypothetical protein RS82_04120 [Microbacterium trichothecenolyticum]
MTAASAAKKPAAPRTRKPAAPKPAPVVDEVVETPPTPSEAADMVIEREELRRALLAELPELRPAHRFRLGHRNAFHNLSLEAMKSGAFDRETLDYDLTKPEDIEDFQKLQKFVESIDDWAESIAVDVDAYVEWSERVGNGDSAEETFMALFSTYQADLGESRGSGN